MSRSARPQRRARRAADDHHRTGQAARAPRTGGQPWNGWRAASGQPAGRPTAQDGGPEQTPPDAGPSIGGSEKPRGSRASGLWLLLIPLACCGGPLLAAGLAAAGALAWGGLGLMLAVALTGAGLLARHRSRACRAPRTAGTAGQVPWRSRRGDHPRQPSAGGAGHRAADRRERPGQPGLRRRPPG